MKRTDLERRERELKRSLKKDDVLRRKAGSGAGLTVGNYIEQLFMLFRYDENDIFNTTDDINVLELLEGMKVDQPEKQWDTILRKAIGRTKIANKEKAYNELCSMIQS